MGHNCAVLVHSHSSHQPCFPSQKAAVYSRKRSDTPTVCYFWPKWKTRGAPHCLFVAQSKRVFFLYIAASYSTKERKTEKISDSKNKAFTFHVTNTLYVTNVLYVTNALKTVQKYRMLFLKRWISPNSWTLSVLAHVILTGLNRAFFWDKFQLLSNTHLVL